MAISDRRTGSVEDVVLVTTLASTTAPSAAEINAGTRLEPYMIGGLDRPRSGNVADVSAINDRENYSIPASIDNGPLSAMMWREFDGTDTAWAACDDTTNPPPTRYLVVAAGGFAGATAAADDVVDVYTVQISARESEAAEKDEAQRFRATWAVQGTDFDSVIVA